MQDERGPEIIISINMDEGQDITEINHGYSMGENDNTGNDLTAMDYAEVLFLLMVCNFTIINIHLEVDNSRN